MAAPPAPFDVLEMLGHLARTQRHKLIRVARREGASAEDAVDCVQDALCTFLRLAQQGELPLPDTAHLPAYLAVVVRNAARNRRRKHDVARRHEPVEAAPPLADDSSEDLVTRAEEHVRLRACVERLCDTQKAVVLLRLLDEQPGDDVAGALGISRGYVDVLLHRARASLRVCMTET